MSINSHSQTYRLKLLLGHTRDHKTSTYPPQPYAFRFHGNSECLPPGYLFRCLPQCSSIQTANPNQSVFATQMHEISDCRSKQNQFKSCKTSE